MTHGRLWFALLGGGIAWTLHLLLAYTIAEFGCLSGPGERGFGGLSVVNWMLLGLSLFALGLAIVATRLSKRLGANTRLDQTAEPSETRGHSPSQGRGGQEPASIVAFSGRLAYLTNLAFTAIIVVQSVPIFYFFGKC